MLLPCLSPTPKADAMKNCRGESLVGGKGGKGWMASCKGGPSPCFLFLSQTFSGKRPNALPPPLVFQIFSLDHYTAGPHLLLPYWRVWEIQKQREIDLYKQLRANIRGLLEVSISALPFPALSLHFYQWLDTLPIIFLLSSFSVIKNRMSSSA